MNRIEFTESLRKLLNYCHYVGIQVQIDWVRRSVREQEHLVRSGRSWTMNSRHLSAMAVDLLVIENGEFVEDGWQYEAMGRYWKSLGEGHIWGGDWKNRDVYHFEAR